MLIVGVVALPSAGGGDATLPRPSVRPGVAASAPRVAALPPRSQAAVFASNAMTWDISTALVPPPRTPSPKGRGLSQANRMNAAVLFGSSKSVNPCFAHENGWLMLPQVLLFKTIRIGWQLEKAATAPAAPAPVSRGIPDPVGAARFGRVGRFACRGHLTLASHSPRHEHAGGT